MRAAVPVLLLVALAGCQSVFSASLDVASKEDASDERVEISDLQKSEETEDEAKSEEEKVVHDNCFGKAVREEPGQKLNLTASSVSEEIKQDNETQSAKEEKTEDEGTEARAEVRAQTLNLAEEERDKEYERIDIEVLQRADFLGHSGLDKGETDVAVE